MFKPLDPLLHSELRLAIVSLLISVESADFTYIREQTEATAGNLSIQLGKLEQAGYVAIEKRFNGKMPQTVCRITPEGIGAFQDYLDALRGYILPKVRKEQGE